MDISPEMQETFLLLQEQIKEESAIAEELMKNDPKLSPMSAMIIAGDRLSAIAADKMLEEGATFAQAQVRVGSFARLDWSVRAMERGFVSLDKLLDDLPDLWRGSDPDDTDPRFRNLWKQAWERNGKSYVRDGRPLPRGKVLTIYRGQDEDAPFGIAWTTDPKIAEKFARGAGSRQANRFGVVYIALVQRRHVYAYLTERGESEVIVDPKWLMPVKGN